MVSTTCQPLGREREISSFSNGILAMVMGVGLTAAKLARPAREGNSRLKEKGAAREGARCFHDERKPPL